jgi:DNA repair protein SbcC/Rad50
MIPLRIQLKNFLSYGSELQTIDFEPYHLICLSGKNGHGKSALLDAITWAVWGQARKEGGNAKADQGLLRLGQKQMIVIYDFIFNDHLYRIRREFAITHGKPYACLEFGILNRETDTITPLTDKTIRATQEKINQMIGLEYEAFSNSAFLRQGHANEFSKKSPKERKTILAQIIGLERYELLKKAALEKSRTIQQKKAEYESLSQRLNQELERNDELKKNMSDLNAKFKKYLDQEKQLKNDQTALESEKNKLAQDAQLFAVIDQQLKHSTQELKKQDDFFHTTMATWRSTHKKLCTVGDGNALQKAKKETTQLIDSYQKTVNESLQIKKELLQTQEQLQKIDAQMTATYTQELNDKKASLNLAQIGTQAIEEKLVHLKQEHEALTQEESIITQKITAQQNSIKNSITEEILVSKEQQFEKLRSYYHKWVARANMLTSKKSDINQKQTLCGDEQSPSCPLCEQNLSASRKRFLQTKFNNESAMLTHQLNRLVKNLRSLKEQLVNDHATLQKDRLTIKNNALSSATIKEFKAQQAILIAKKKQLEDAQRIRDKELKEKQQLITQLQKGIDELRPLELIKKEHKEYIASSQHIELLTKKMQASHIDEKVYIQATKKLDTIEQQLATLDTFRTQKAEQDHRKQLLFIAAKQIKELSQACAIQEKKLAPIQALHEAQEKLAQKNKELDKQFEALNITKTNLLQEKGRLEALMAKLEQFEKEQKSLQETIKELTLEIDQFQIIATALGKDGIQALLIEDTIPEIEQEANALLAKLTDNQAQIFIESLRDLKKGGAKETLDIKISDAAGIRSYEMFSGGEAFRIDFALRVAISKLLARRAGTSLQTLIIDEGFGSQDEEGLQHIMDAIYKIQDDFSKVIIVSHLPAMKNQFPVHFVVEKGAQGSVINIVEQG